jgi:hypothetical protein
VEVLLLDRAREMAVRCASGGGDNAGFELGVVLGEAALAGCDEKITGMYGENASLKAKVSELATLIQEERKGSEEKLAVLDDAQVKLSDAFKALSAEALKSNNQSFL